MQDVIKIISEGTEEPISLDMAKQYMRVQSVSDDVLIANLIRTVRMYAEKYMRVSLIGRVIEVVVSAPLPVKIALPYSPVVAVLRVQSVARDGLVSVVDPRQYLWEEGSEYLCFLRIPSGRSVRAQYSAGFMASASLYAASSGVPQDIINTMLHHIFALYKNRGGGAEINKSVYDQYRIIKVAGNH